jgi:iron-sulfur cluster repair protein YtfE (RIC family)
LAKRATAGRRPSKRTAKAKGTAKAKRSTKKTKGAPAARRKTAARAAATRRRRSKPAAKPSTLGIAGAVMRGAVEGAVMAVAKRLPWTTTENDALMLLEADHRRFEELLKQGEETTERAAKRRRQLLDTLTRELNEHELMEEEVLYPALEPHAQTRAIVLEGYEEHHVADVITRELRDVPPDDERWAAKFKVLKESLEHHIQEEERVMFRTARAVFSREELNGLGARMKALKAESRR